MTGRFYLGMDGGGTGCRGRLVDHTGKVLAEAASGAANIATDRAQALHSILAVAQQVAAGHCALEEITAGLGLAGASLSAPRDWIAAHLPFKSARIVQDVETSLIGALNDQDGIIAAIGTGSVFASQRAGQRRIIGGWGLRLGDEASGAWIGRELCRAALRAIEAGGAQSPLIESLVLRLGGVQGIVAFGASAAPSDFAGFVPDLLIARQAGDVAAIALFESACAQVAESVAQLQSGDTALPVVFLGGLGPVFAEAFAARWHVIAAQGTALDGAVRLAMRGEEPNA